MILGAFIKAEARVPRQSRAVRLRGLFGQCGDARSEQATDRILFARIPICQHVG